MHQAAGDRHTLLLPAGQLPRLMVQAVTQADRFEHLLGNSRVLPQTGLRIGQLERHTDILRRGQRVEEVVGLKDKPDSFADAVQPLRVGRSQIFTKYVQFPGLDATQCADQSQQCRFPRATRAGHNDDFPSRCDQLRTIEHLFAQLASPKVMVYPTRTHDRIRAVTILRRQNRCRLSFGVHNLITYGRPAALQAAAAAALGLCGLLFTSGCREDTGDGPLPVEPAIDSRQVAAQGKLMPASGIVSLSSVPGDQIESILVRTGEQVRRGDVLVEMRSNRLRQIELEAAEQRLQEAMLQQQAKRTEAQLAVTAAKLKLRQAELALEQAKKQREIAGQGESQLALLAEQVDRVRRLRQDPQTRNLVGDADVDLKELERGRAEQIYRQSLLSADQAIQTAELNLELAKQSRDSAEKSLELVDSSATIDSLKKQIELLQIQLEQTRIVAPIDATVLAIGATIGELAGPTPIIELGDLRRMVCQSEVHEADVTRIAIGDAAQMTSAALPTVLTGQVKRIESLVGTPQMRLPNPMARTDFRAVPVEIEISQEYQATAAALVQLQVDVIITPAPKTP